LRPLKNSKRPAAREHFMIPIVYAREQALTAAEFIDVLQRSGLSERRPVDDRDRIERMLAHSNLIVTARVDGRLVGVSRALTDFGFCCYLSDLAVDRSCQRSGIGRRLIEETRRAAGPQAACILLSAPGALDFYRAIGMPQADNAFVFQRTR
jgi:ribosomal protein S18 acetylase RimI-like enzyme